MKVSYNYLKQLVGFKNNPQEVANLINLHITEVEEILSSSRYEGVVVGEITEINPHPNADKLQLTKINVGDKILDIICGASNIEVGQKVPVALEGATLPSGLDIRSAVIRSERSHGMLCSKAELSLEKESEGIWILDENSKVGTPLSEVIGEDSDTIFDLKVLANRPDYLSYLSITREIAAVLKIDFKPDIKYDFVEGKDKSSDSIDIRIEDYKLCPRYIGRVIRNIEVKESPRWMQQVLLASGLRPINNIVDISNYVLLELGQPTHAFDLSKIGGSQIIVRRAKSGETVNGLDGSLHKLDSPMVVIADSTKPLAVGGVVGGEESSVVEGTADILLEVANFNMTSIRKTSRSLGIHTDSSARFERGLSVLLPEIAMRRMVHLIQQECPNCQVLAGAVDVYERLPLETVELKVDADKVNQLAGVKIEVSEMADILESLDMPTQVKGQELMIQVPDYRKDVQSVSDVTEEVIRIYGINKIPYDMPTIKSSPQELDPLRLLVRRVKDILARLGFLEVYLQPFDGGSQNAIGLANPLVSALTHLKTELTTALNEAQFMSGGHRVESCRVFELNTVFSDHGDVLPREVQQLAGRIKELDAYRQARGVVTSLLNQLGVTVGYHEVQGLKGVRILIGKEPMGEVVQASNNDAGFVLEIDSLLPHIILNRSFKPLPKFPPIKFDMAFVMPHRVRIGEVSDAIRSADILVDKVELFDVHDMDESGKNLAFHIEIRSSKRTLSGEDRQKVEERVKNALLERFKAKLRES